MIELGELRHGDEHEPEPVPRRGAPPARTGRAVLLAVLALLTLAASAPPPAGQRYVTIAGPPEGTFRIADGRLFVIDDPTGRGGTPEVAAYPLPVGDRLWRLRLPRGQQPVDLHLAAGSLLVLTRTPESGESTATAVDPATGRVRWRQPGYPLSARHGLLLFEVQSPAGGPAVLRGVDAASGAQRWSRPVPAGGVGYEFGPDGIGHVVLLGPSGRVQVLDGGSGAVLRVGRMPATATTADGQQPGVFLVDGLLMVDDRAGTLTAYGLDRLDRRWSIPVESGLGQILERCGDGLCLRTGRPGLGLVDRATGRVRWRVEASGTVWPLGDRLLVAADGEQREVDLVLLDQRTGRQLGALGQWQLSWADPTRDPMIGLRRLDGGGRLVARLDVTTGRSEALDVLSGEWDGCANDRRVLVCRQPDGTLGVWRLDR
ncbi:PQQ-binding-like beta-propeller repeat protein [Micromonospora sp. NPDC050686]|uniref:PQQ-binding-like beta-propeller repeat protein n=1 Tax=Micromonospora sp. NPDC050686 TaxID=3154631 RepID=UPI0033F07618